MDKKLKLTERQIARAATNDPSLSEREFQLGDRTFPLVDLPYDDYVVFLGHLQPLMEAIAGRFSATQDLVSSEEITVSGLAKYCAKALPEMVTLMARQSDPTMTTDVVKQMGRSPFKLATIVMKQIEQNKVISDIADFFEQVLPVIKALWGTKTKQSA